MSGLCLLVAGLLAAQLGDAVTLRWAHSIEKIVWEEDYVAHASGLRLIEARVRGTGAGMEPPEGAVLKGGAWHYVPRLTTLPKVSLRHTPHAPPYVICADSRCQPVDHWLPGLPEDTVIDLRPCAD